MSWTIGVFFKRNLPPPTPNCPTRRSPCLQPRVRTRATEPPPPRALALTGTCASCGNREPKRTDKRCSALSVVETVEVAVASAVRLAPLVRRDNDRAPSAACGVGCASFVRVTSRCWQGGHDTRPLSIIKQNTKQCTPLLCSRVPLHLTSKNTLADDVRGRARVPPAHVPVPGLVRALPALPQEQRRRVLRGVKGGGNGPRWGLYKLLNPVDDP
jgi:hypothetical protein